MGGLFLLPLVRRAAILAALAVVALLAVTATASAEAPCWKRLTLDWAADGSVDSRYDLPCYQQAIDHLRSDQKLYSSAEDDIRRALQRAIVEQSSPDSSAGAAKPDQPATGDGGGVPVPLLVLGGVAILLVAAGAAGVLRRRGRHDEPGAS